MTPMLDSHRISTLRAETPGTTHVVHLNNAGAALMPQPVLQAMQAHLDLEMRIGGYEAAKAMRPEIETFYDYHAALLGTHRRNIAIAANATDAYNRALSSVVLDRDDVILTTTNDYASNHLAFLSLQRRLGIRIQLLANDPTGVVDLDGLRSDLRRFQPKVLAVTHVPTNSGLIQPVDQIGEICTEHDAIYLVDGCQSVGQLATDVARMRCDFFSATCRKFLRGPRGCGFLYISDRVLSGQMHPLFIDMRGADWTGSDTYKLRTDAGRYEDWENPYALILGTATAAKYALSIGMRHIEERVKQLAEELRQKLASIDGLTLLDRGSHRAAIVTFHIGGTAPEALSQYLLEQRINHSTVALSSALLDFQEKRVPWALRLSPHYYNTPEELDLACRAISDFMRQHG